MCQTCSRTNFGISVPSSAIYAIILYAAICRSTLVRSKRWLFWLEPDSGSLQPESLITHRNPIAHLIEHLARAQEGPPEMVFVH